MIVSPVMFYVITHVAIEVIEVNPVDYSFTFGEFDKNEMLGRINDCDENEDYHSTEEERQFIRDLTWDTVLYPEIHSFSIRNNEPINHRRPLVFGKMTPAGLTVRDIAEGIMRVKENKYDFWYELFCGFKEKSVVDGHATYVVDFDHGS